MFSFWDKYKRMVKAERTGNWCLHLAAVSSMTPFFFARDRHNYSCWLPVYLADMEQLQQKHPKVYQRFMEGDNMISRSSQPFSSVWTDMVLQQSINLDLKSKVGIVGISLTQRGFLTATRERQSPRQLGGCVEATIRTKLAPTRKQILREWSVTRTMFRR